MKERHEKWLGDDPLYLKFRTKLTLFEQKCQICRFSIDIRL